MAGFQFNAEEHQPLDGFEVMPAGDYMASIVESEIKPAKSGQSTYLELVWEILDGEFKERRVWHRIMITHSSSKAVAMGKRKLSSVCHALGVLQLSDSTELHEIPTLIRIGVREQAGYDPTNEITGFPAAKKTGETSTPF